MSQLVEDDFDMSKLIDQILLESGFAESRASKMDVDDFLKYAGSLLCGVCLSSCSHDRSGRLLTVFHKHGVHFA